MARWRVPERGIAGVYRALVIAVIGAIVLAVALVLTVYIMPGPDGPPEQTAAGGGDSPAIQDAPPGGGFIGLPPSDAPKGKGIPAPGRTGRSRVPSFDIVRISPEGNTVIAGRAPPGAEVTVLDDGRVIGKVASDARGEWVLVPEKPLPPGKRRLGLRAKLTDGATVDSAGEVVLVVPEPGRDVAGRRTAGPSGSIALRVPKSRPDGAPPGPAESTVLQLPGVGPGPSGPKDVLSVDVIDYDRSGRVRIGGAARPGARVRIYLDNRPLGEARGDHAGKWSFRPKDPLEPGTYKLRVDELGSGGRVGRRIEIPFERAPAIADLPDSGIAVVQPGNSLWRIARRTYGSGFEYTVIYEANKDQIRDPDLIYPGQIFTLPDRGPVN